MTSFLENVMSEQFWLRVFYIILGTLLVYFALVQDTGRINLDFGKGGR